MPRPKFNKICQRCGIAFVVERFEEQKFCSRLCSQGGLLKDRFEALTDRTDGHGPWGNCWLYTGKLDDGYGKMLPTNGKAKRYVHVLSYELHIGSVPQGLELDHLCRVRNCINPAHLDPVTHAENMRRSPFQGVIQKAKTHCPQGHPYDGENLYINSNRRHCKICMRIREKQFRARQKSAC